LTPSTDHQRFWSPVVRTLTPYVPGEQPRIDGLIKLNTNEHPLGPAPGVLAAIREAADDSLRLYPDPDARALKEALAQLHGLPPAQVFVGNGSDEVLAHAFFGLLDHGRPVLFPDVTYSFYPVYCGLYGLTAQRVPLDDRFGVRIDDYRRDNGGIVLANPNAPTGRLLPLAQIERLLESNPASVVLIDEAYVDFGGESAVGLIGRFPQLLVVRTFSKSRSLAGLRVGYAMGHPGLIEALERVKNCFNSYPLHRLVRAKLRSRDRRARGDDGAAARAGFRGAAFLRQLRVRAPPGPRGRRAAGGIARAAHPGAPFQGAAHRSVSADHRRHARTRKGTGRSSAGDPGAGLNGRGALQGPSPPAMRLSARSAGRSRGARTGCAVTPPCSSVRCGPGRTRASDAPQIRPRSRPP
jgi:histidinol-phosphate aminotransferase